MTRLTCEDCSKPIPNGTAHIRSALFRQVAYCATCWRIRMIATALRAVA
jgi:RNase P subunit RPR2